MTMAHPSTYRRRPRRAVGTAAPGRALYRRAGVEPAHRRRREDGGRPAGRAAPLGLGGQRPTLTVVEPVAERRDELAAEYPGLRTVAAPEPGLLDDAGERLGGAVLAVKPDAAEGACRALGVTGVTRLLSIVAGRPLPAPGGRPRRRARRGPGHAQHAGAGRGGGDGDLGRVLRHLR